MKSFIIITITILASILLSLHFVSAQSKHLFHIPIFPGMVPFHTEHSNKQEINLPFITSLRVYRTANGAPLNVDTVLSFYESHFRRIGWKDAINKRIPPEPYLALSIDLAESREENVHLAGDITFWIAPKDGMLTILCEQWRISSPGQKTINNISLLQKSLSDLAGEFHYSMQKIYYTSAWVKYYENEYLTACSAYTLSSSHIGRSSCVDPEGLINATILAYSDSTFAHAEAKRIRNHWDDDADNGNSNSDPNIFLVHLGQDRTEVIQFNKILLLLSDQSGKQKSQINALVDRLTQKMK